MRLAAALSVARLGGRIARRANFAKMSISDRGVSTADPRRHETPNLDWNFGMPNFDSVNFCTTVKP
jgi:hypothetical protein